MSEPSFDLTPVVSGKLFTPKFFVLWILLSALVAYYLYDKEQRVQRAEFLAQKITRLEDSIYETRSAVESLRPVAKVETTDAETVDG